MFQISCLHFRKLFFVPWYCCIDVVILLWKVFVSTETCFNRRICLARSLCIVMESRKDVFIWFFWNIFWRRSTWILRGCRGLFITMLHSFFYKDTGKLGWSSICLRFSQFEPEIMLDGMLNSKTHFMVWYCVWYEHCNGLL